MGWCKVKTTYTVRIPVRQLAVYEVEVEAKTQSGAFSKALELLKGGSEGEVLDQDDSNLKVAIKKEELELFNGEKLAKNIPSSVEIEG